MIKENKILNPNLAFWMHAAMKRQNAVREVCSCESILRSLSYTTIVYEPDSHQWDLERQTPGASSYGQPMPTKTSLAIGRPEAYSDDINNLFLGTAGLDGRWRKRLTWDPKLEYCQLFRIEILPFSDNSTEIEEKGTLSRHDFGLAVTIRYAFLMQMRRRKEARADKLGQSETSKEAKLFERPKRKSANNDAFQLGD
ncbi:hypothetical protein V1477_001834 [Vespula maculifrons]|uniref:Uncharacterized protein n=1 Tax=Vespula maculifrons TaxID=7453 RepID=A0ABD2D038_VESMC